MAKKVEKSLARRGATTALLQLEEGVIQDLLVQSETYKTIRKTIIAAILTGVGAVAAAFYHYLRDNPILAVAVGLALLAQIIFLGIYGLMPRLFAKTIARRLSSKGAEGIPLVVDRTPILWSTSLFKERTAEWILENAKPTHNNLGIPDLVVICKIGSHWSAEFSEHSAPRTARALNRSAPLKIGFLFARPVTDSEKRVATLKDSVAKWASMTEALARNLDVFRCFFTDERKHLRDRVEFRYIDVGLVDSMCAFEAEEAVVSLDINKGWQEDHFPIVEASHARHKELYEVLIARVAYLWNMGTTIDSDMVIPSVPEPQLPTVAGRDTKNSTQSQGFPVGTGLPSAQVEISDKIEAHPSGYYRIEVRNLTMKTLKLRVDLKQIEPTPEAITLPLPLRATHGHDDIPAGGSRQIDVFRAPAGATQIEIQGPAPIIQTRKYRLTIEAHGREGPSFQRVFVAEPTDGRMVLTAAE